MANSEQPSKRSRKQTGSQSQQCAVLQRDYVDARAEARRLGQELDGLFAVGNGVEENHERNTAGHRAGQFARGRIVADVGDRDSA